MPVRIFLCQLGTEVAGRCIDINFAFAQPAFKLCIAGLDVVRGIAGHDDYKVLVCRTSKLAHLCRSFRKTLAQPLEIVDELRALLQVEHRMIVFAFLAAQLTHLGDAQRNHRQRGIDVQRRKILIGKRGPHIGQSRQTQIGLVRAVLLHRLVVGNARKRRGQLYARSGKARGQKFSTTANTCSRRGKLISRSTCVNSSWRSARKSSSRKQRAI